jgi:hypothetical protein
MAGPFIESNKEQQQEKRELQQQLRSSISSESSESSGSSNLCRQAQEKDSDGMLHGHHTPEFAAGNVNAGPLLAYGERTTTPFSINICSLASRRRERVVPSAPWPWT